MSEERFARGLRRLVTPQCVDQRLALDRPPSLEQQDRKQLAASSGRDRHRRPSSRWTSRSPSRRYRMVLRKRATGRPSIDLAPSMPQGGDKGATSHLADLAASAATSAARAQGDQHAWTNAASASTVDASIWPPSHRGSGRLGGRGRGRLPALAARPTREVIDIGTPEIELLIGANLTEVCGFEISVDADATLAVMVFSNNDGTFRREIDPGQVKWTLTNLATGVSIDVHNVGPDIYWVNRDGESMLASIGRLYVVHDRKSALSGAPWSTRTPARSWRSEAVSPATSVSWSAPLSPRRRSEPKRSAAP